MAEIVAEGLHHAPFVEHLLDTAFGPGRFAKTAYRLREGVEPLADLSYVALNDDGRVVGSLRYWPVMIDRTMPAIMLGPLAVDGTYRSNGVGMALMDISLAKATRLGHRICVLVGDEPYYAKVGFSRDLARGLYLPGPVDPSRLLAKELVPGALANISGLIHRSA